MTARLPSFPSRPTAVARPDPAPVPCEFSWHSPAFLHWSLAVAQSSAGASPEAASSGWLPENGRFTSRSPRGRPRSFRQRLNSDIAVSNIKNIVDRLGFDLVTYVINWHEFRDLQRAFIRASVVDIEMLTDQAIVASILRLARQHRIRYVLNGSNTATEHDMQPNWVWNKQDLRNVQSHSQAVWHCAIEDILYADRLALPLGPLHSGADCSTCAY